MANSDLRELVETAAMTEFDSDQRRAAMRNIDPLEILTLFKERDDLVIDYTRQRLRVRKLKTLERTLRTLDHLGHRDECHLNFGRPHKEDYKCDCPAKDVRDALKALED